MKREKIKVGDILQGWRESDITLLSICAKTAGYFNETF